MFSQTCVSAELIWLALACTQVSWVWIKDVQGQHMAIVTPVLGQNGFSAKNVECIWASLEEKD